MIGSGERGKRIMGNRQIAYDRQRKIGNQEEMRQVKRRPGQRKLRRLGNGLAARMRRGHLIGTAVTAHLAAASQFLGTSRTARQHASHQRRSCHQEHQQHRRQFRRSTHVTL